MEEQLLAPPLYGVSPPERRLEDYQQLDGDNIVQNQEMVSKTIKQEINAIGCE